MGDGRVRFDVGGTTFITSTTTIANAGQGSMLSALIDGRWHQPSDAGIFLDRDPSYFAVLLELLRTGELHVPPGMSRRALHREALFYGLLDHVKEAQRGPLNGNLVECRASISGRAIGDGIAIRASSDGGCCVAHETMVHVYDWALEEKQPLTLDYVSVNDMGFLNPERVVICTYERGEQIGGMACFNVNTGEIEHRYQVTHEGQGKNFPALAFASNHRHVFASCRKRISDYGIGVWDQTTGEHLDFFHDSEGTHLGDARKLQWLPQSNVLFVASLYPQSDNSFISLLDFRMKQKAWTWTDSKMRSSDDKLVMDTVAMDERSTVCVVNQYDNLGFIDTRLSQQAVKWNHMYTHAKLSESEEHCYSRLAACGSQVYASRRDNVLVYCCSDKEATRCIQTANLSKEGRGTISDIAIGGDRLFVLQAEENLFDVWETPILHGVGC
ncbi:hypothetical protein O6H91_02G013100 [Diphasiastrum complanatum]|uniref:Uncharacterized protein n=1 Tax=Diphasiastrum complanatum TaxID=34168 RepID=A0ACC2ECT9_DIPCM|nr:hypothetical protein O6H91_Y426500 [Diphasiastrum complanatum]KAJ7564329.1 hypothetical protein O6H91_02G013100 [Diphasiastrum complanatum]